MRSQLIEAMGCVSEDRYCCGWMPGLSQSLHAEGGIWELIGRAIGWPIGEPPGWRWVTWEQASAIYEKEAA